MSIFDSIISRRPKSSQFNLGHTRKFSFAPGKLYPTMMVETMPGDRLSHDLNAMVRMMPMQAPLMHMVDVFGYTFKIPLRLLMQFGKWDVLITGGKDGNGEDAEGNFIEIPHAFFQSADITTNTRIASGALAPGTLADYLGIGVGTVAGTAMPLNMMPFIAFWLVWNENFRDQNLHPDYVGLYPGIFQATGNINQALYDAINDPDNPFDFFALPQVCWEKDYFTSALPFAQRGAPVETPLEGSASIDYSQPAVARKVGGLNPAPAGDIKAASMVPGLDATIYNSSTEGIAIENIDDINLITGGFSINDLRVAARLQEFLEKMARGGARYTEYLKSVWGTVSKDATLQRPQYLAGGKIPVNISEVLQTSENGTTPIATMAGHGVSAGKINGWAEYFEEQCYVLSVVFMRPKTAYQQGIPRLFTHRFDRLDYPNPSFAQLGEQEIATSEIYSTFDEATNKITWGYQQRYAEMKYIPSTVHGEFKTTLNFWHWGRIFSSNPTLSPEFVNCDPSPRIFNVIEDGDPCYCVLYNNLRGNRPLPYYGEPTL